eukprot:12269490-Ditylum_brightwellii.AAC.1
MQPLPTWDHKVQGWGGRRTSSIRTPLPLVNPPPRLGGAWVCVGADCCGGGAAVGYAVGGGLPPV